MDLLILVIDGVNASGESMTITFTNPNEGLGGQWLQDNFLPVAEPVLGLASITSAYYTKTERTDII